MYEDLRMDELAGVGVTQEHRSQNGGKVKLCGSGNDKPCGFSDITPTCQCSPEAIHAGSSDGLGCEPIAIIGMGRHLETQI